MKRFLFAAGLFLAASAPASAQQLVGSNQNTACPPTGVSIVTGLNPAYSFNGALCVYMAGGTVSLTWPGTAVPTNWGTAPSGTVPAVNAFVINSNSNVTAGGNPAVDASPVILAPAPSTYQVIWPNNTTGISIKGSAGTFYAAQFGGIGSAPVYVKLYDTASAPTCGSGTPKKRFIIPKAATATDGAGSNISIPGGVKFASGIGICVTGGITDADTTAPAASTWLINIDYQ